MKIIFENNFEKKNENKNENKKKKKYFIGKIKPIKYFKTGKKEKCFLKGKGMRGIRGERTEGGRLIC